MPHYRKYNKLKKKTYQIENHYIYKLPKRYIAIKELIREGKKSYKTISTIAFRKAITIYGTCCRNVRMKSKLYVNGKSSDIF